MAFNPDTAKQALASAARISSSSARQGGAPPPGGPQGIFDVIVSGASHPTRALEIGPGLSVTVSDGVSQMTTIGTGDGAITYATNAAFRAAAAPSDGQLIRILTPPKEFRYSSTSGAGWADDNDTLLKPSSVSLGSNGRAYSTAASEHAATFAAARAMLGILGRAKHVHIASRSAYRDGAGGVFDVTAVGAYADDDGDTLVAGTAALLRRSHPTRVNVASFGASASASRSANRIAFERALAVLLVFGGGTLEIPNETLPIEPAIATLPCVHVAFAGVHIVGLGRNAGLQVFNSAHVPILVASNPDLSIAPTGTVIDGVEISHVKIVGSGSYVNYALAYGRGILLRNVTHGVVHHCHVSKMSMIGICSEGSCGYLSFSDNTLEDCYYSGLNYNGRAYHSTLANNTISGSVSDANSCAIQVDGPCSVINNRVFGSASAPSLAGGILWGEGDWHGIGTIADNIVTHCRFGVKAQYHGPVAVRGNTIINCAGGGGGILIYGGVTTGFDVPVENSIVAENTVINCAPYQIEVSAVGTMVRDNQIYNIAAPSSPSGSSEPDYISTATVVAGIAIRGAGISAVGNHVDGATYGITTLLGAAEGPIASNSFARCTYNYAQEAPAYYSYAVVLDRQREQVGSGYVDTLFGAAKPAAGYFSAGSRWINTAPGVGKTSEARVAVAQQTTLSAQANAGDTALAIVATSAVDNHALVGVVLDNGAIHWSELASFAANTWTIVTPIPVGRFAASGAVAYANSWTFATPSQVIPVPMILGTGTSGLLGSPGQSSTLPKLTENTAGSPESHYWQGPMAGYVAGRRHTLRCLVKASGRDAIRIGDGGANACGYLLTNGTLVSKSADVTASIHDMGGGVYDCYFTALWATNQVYIYLSTDGLTLSYNGTGASVIFYAVESITS